MSERIFDNAPETLVDRAGRVALGVFKQPLRRVGIDQARFGWLGGTAPAAARGLRLKQWQHFCVISPDLLLTFAIVDAGYLKTGWVQVVELATGRRFERETKGPASLHAHVADALWDAQSSLRVSGLDIDIHNHLAGGVHEVSLDVAADADRPHIDAAFVCAHDLAAIDPLVVSLPLGRGRAMYSHKVPLPVSGQVRVGERTYTLSPTDTVAILDIHKAHYPRHTWWKWATLAGFDAAGRILAVNLTDNVAQQTERWTENAVWVGGRCHRLSPVRYAFDRRSIHAPWSITTAEGEVDLEFRPTGGRKERLQIGPLVRSNFDQLYGTFHGTVVAGGERLEIDGLRGLCEDHDALW